MNGEYDMPREVSAEIVSFFPKTRKSTYISPKFSAKLAENGIVYFGTGLASVKEESRGFGWELLTTILTALRLSKRLGSKGVLHEIGTVGYTISLEHRDRLIRRQMEIMQRLLVNLKLDDFYKLILSHSYHDSISYNNIFKDVQNSMNKYIHLENFENIGAYTTIQLAQMKYLNFTECAYVKLGWVIDSHPPLEMVGQIEAEELINNGKLNEYYFDNMYRSIYPDDVFLFTYTPPGFDWINGKKYAPYTVTKSQNRPLLTDPIQEYVKNIPESRHKHRILEIFKTNIVLPFEEYFGEIHTSTSNSDSPEDMIINKLSFIQEFILKKDTTLKEKIK